MAAFGLLLPVSLALTVTGILRLIRRPYGTDAAAYYAIGRLAIVDGFDHIYDVGAQQRAWHSVGPLDWYVNMQTPFLAFLAAPLALLPLPAALAAWELLAAGSLLLVWWLASPGSGRFDKSLSLVAMLSLLPVAFGLALGQVVFGVMAAVALSFWLLRSGRPLPAGLVLCLIAVKPQVAFMVPALLLVSGHVRAFWAWLGATAVLIVVALGVVGQPALGVYVHRLAGASQDSAPLAGFATTLASLAGNGGMALALQAGVALLAMLAAWRWRAEVGVVVALGVVSSVLITPFIHLQDLAVLVLPALIGLQAGLPAWSKVLVGVGYMSVQLAGSAAGGLPVIVVQLAWLAGFLAAAPPARLPAVLRRKGMGAPSDGKELPVPGAQL